MRANGRERPVENSDRASDQRLLCKEASVRNKIPRGEIVGTVGNDVIGFDEIDCVLRNEPCCMHLDHDMRIKATDRGGRAINFRHSDFRRAMNHLTLQIRQCDVVVVDDAERSHAGRR